MAPVGKAEAGSAGEQPAEEYQPETHRGRWEGRGVKNRAL